MKRFPFFYDISNWFVPFYLQHPDIRNFVNRMQGNKFMEKMMKTGPFCNSDKYSFIIAFQQVIDRIPESMRKMLEQGEATMGEIPADELATPAFIRRAYLMDLYRFYRLFPSRNEFENPFNTSAMNLGACEFFSLWLFKGSPLEPYKDQIVRLLKRKKMEEPAMRLLDSYSDDHRSLQYYIWYGQYHEALKLDPHNEKALRGKARELFDLGIFDEAMDAYDDLLLLYPDHPNYLLNKAVCLGNLSRYDEALAILYKMNYEHEDDLTVRRVLAWTLVGSGKEEQASRMYSQLLDGVQPEGDDLLNYGLCQWLMGDIVGAAGLFKQYADSMAGGDAPFDAAQTFFHQEVELLHRHGISDVEIRLMIDLLN
jgi:tetratricopeptide (TPR) repeat protein